MNPEYYQESTHSLDDTVSNAQMFLMHHLVEEV